MNYDEIIARAKKQSTQLHHSANSSYLQDNEYDAQAIDILISVYERLTEDGIIN